MIRFWRTGLLLTAACAPLAETPPPNGGSVSAPLAFAAPGEAGYRDNLLLRFEEAETLYRGAAADAAGGAVERAENEAYLALNKSNVGEHDLAESIFAGARRTLDAEGGVVGRVRVRVLYAEHRMNVGDPEGARAAATEALALAAPSAGGAPPASIIALAGPDPLVTPELAGALGGGGDAAAFDLGELSAADRLTILRAQARYVLAAAALAGAPGDAAAETAAAEALLGAVAADQTDWLRAAIASLQARRSLADGDLAAADERAGRAVALSRRYAPGGRPEALARLLQGRIQLEAGREAAARGSFDAALAILARGGRGTSFDELGPYLRLLASDPPSARRDATAFLALQQVRNPITSDTLARLGARLAAGDTDAGRAIRALQDGERAVNSAAAELDQLTAATERDVHAVAVARGRLAEAQAAAAAARETVARAAPNYGQINDRSISLAELQAALRPGELFVQLRLGETGGAVAAVSPDAVTFEALDMDRGAAAALVQRVRDSIQSGGAFDVEAAHALYVGLLGPIGEAISASGRLIVAPDGPLLSLPPGVLVERPPTGWTPGSSDYTGVAWLGLARPTSVTLSAASFALLRASPASSASEPFRGFGDFQPISPQSVAAVARRRSAAPSCASLFGDLANIPRLAGTGEEVRRIAEIVTGDVGAAVTGADFTDTAILSSGLGDARVLHFATHGLLPLSSECLPEPSLTTSLGDERSDGLLEAGEIVELDLDADLVVLSACDTGGFGGGTALGTGFRNPGGEALSGLVRAFFFAGARNVVASHWVVPDAETVALMQIFYLGLKEGKTSDDALLAAQAALAAEPRFSHPFYWGAFAVNGDAASAAPFAPNAASAAP